MSKTKKSINLEKHWELVNFCEFDKYATKSYCAIHNVDESLNLGDITKVDETKLADFNMMTWGFPCTDISVAGKQKGFLDEDGNKTRSGMYYEGIRILRYKKPALSIIENVKNLTGKKFKKEFDMVLSDLYEAGYNSYYKVLNAKNYGIPQNRERVFIISIRKDLDNGQFKFPEPFDNGIRLKDILEDKVDEKFYLSDEKVQKFLSNFNQSDLPVTTRNSDTVSTIRATYYKNGERNICENIENGNGYEGVVESNNTKFLGNVNNPEFGTGYAGGVWDSENISSTLTAMQGGGRQSHIMCGVDKSNNNPEIITNANCITAREDRGVSNRKKEGTAVLECVGNINPSGKGMNGNVFSSDGLAPTITTNKGEGNKVLIPQATKQGYIECEVGGVADLSYPNSKTRRGRVQEKRTISPTITATETGICRIEPKERFFKQALETFENSNADYGDTIDAYNKRVNQSGYSPTITTRPEGFKTAILPVTKDIRIRKLTPKECFRLMGFSDQNFDAAKNAGISNSQLYKQAGNSIVVDVLYYIYVELYKAMPYLFDDLKLSSFFSGIGAFESALDRLYEEIKSGNFTNPQVE